MSLINNATHICDGQFHTTKSFFKWIVPLGSGHKNVGDCICSPTFQIYEYEQEYQLGAEVLKWELQLYPMGKNQTYQNSISLFLHNRNSKSIQATAFFSLLNKKNELFRKCSLEKHTYTADQSWGFFNFIEHKYIFEKNNGLLIADDKITILCDIVLDERAINTESNTPSVLTDTTRLQEFDEFEKLFENEQFSDVTIMAENQSLKLHKNILVNRSSVFKAMFEHNMKESCQNVVSINDVPFNILKELFRFMYTGKVNDLKTIVEELLVAADKYNIQGLKKMCENNICNLLNTENVLQYLKIADLYSALILKKHAINYIVLHSEDIIYKREFKSFEHLNLNLAFEVYRAIVQMKEKK